MPMATKLFREGNLKRNVSIIVTDCDSQYLKCHIFKSKQAKISVKRTILDILFLLWHITENKKVFYGIKTSRSLPFGNSCSQKDVFFNFSVISRRLQQNSRGQNFCPGFMNIFYNQTVEKMTQILFKLFPQVVGHNCSQN